MAWGYAIWNSAGKIIDTSESSFPYQCYPGLTSVTGTQTTTYDLLGIGTSSLNFHYSTRKFPSGTHKREMLFTNANLTDSSTFSHNIDPAVGALYVNQVTTFGVIKPDTFTTEDVTSWDSDVAFRTQLILLPAAI